MTHSKLREIIREEIINKLFEQEHKIYVQPGREVPKGKKLQKGPRGGQFFIGSAEDKKKYEKPKTMNIPNFDPELDDPNDHSYERRKEVPREVGEAHFAIQNALKPFKEMYTDADDKKTIEDYAKKQMNKDSFFKSNPSSEVDENDLKRTIKYYTHQLKRRDSRLRSQEKKGFLGNQHFAKVSHQADTIILKNMAEKLQQYIDVYNKKVKSEGIIKESSNIERSKKVSAAFQNLNGFRYYGLESERNNTASIVAPSTNKKWYGQIADKLDKLDIGNYSLNASQKPGYFILTFK